MPIYEFICERCNKVSSFLLLRSTEEVDPRCKACGSRAVRRALSRVAILRGDERRLESLFDPAKFSDLDENNPASMERVLHRMGRELGDEAGEGFEESVAQAFSDEDSTEQGL